MKYSKGLFLIGLLLYSISLFSQKQVLKVNQSGSNGKYSLKEAFDIVEQFNKSNNYPTKGIDIILEKGNYQIDEGFKLNSYHSGKTNAPVSILVEESEVLMFGGKYLKTNWFNALSDQKIINILTDKAAANHILTIDLKQYGINDYGEISRHGWMLEPPTRVAPVGLIIGGERMELARWPNKDEELPYLDEMASNEGLKGMVSYTSIIDKGPSKPETGQWWEDETFMSSGGTFKVAFDRMKHWNNISDIWLDGCLGTTWEWTYNNLAEVNIADKTIKLAYGELNGIGGNLERVSHFYFENIVEELDKPGEYFIDRETGILYLYPPDNFNDKSVFLSTLEDNLFELNQVSNFEMESLTLDAGRRNGIYLNKCSYITIKNCEIRNVSMGGVFVKGNNNLVSNCNIHHVGSFGVEVQGGNKSTLFPGNNIVEHCNLYSLAWDQKSQMSGIFLNRGVGNHAKFNHIWDTPHFAIRMNYTNDCTMEGNVIHDLPTYHMFDGGAVYVYTGPKNPENRGNRVINNFLFNVPTNGIYCDNYAMGVFIEKNYFYNVSYLDGEWGFGAVMLNSGGQNHINNNVFVDCKIPVLWGAGGYHNAYKRNPQIQEAWNDAVVKYGNGQVENTVYSKYETFKEFLALSPENDYYEFKWPQSYAQNNLFVNKDIPLSDKANMPLGYKNNKNKIIVDNSLALSVDPGFKDLQKLNFYLNTASSVFEQIPEFEPGEFYFQIPQNSKALRSTITGDKFQLFPNPAKNNIYIINQQDEFSLEVYNISGNKKGEYRIINGLSSIDISDYVPGTYMCVQFMPSSILSYKLIKE